MDDIALTVWQFPYNSTGSGSWKRTHVGAAWPRRGADVQVRCSSSLSSAASTQDQAAAPFYASPSGGGSDDRSTLLVWTIHFCPSVSVWVSGNTSEPLASFRLALSSSGELLTSHIAAKAATQPAVRVVGGGGGGSVGILDGCVAGEMLLLLTSDGCLRSWALGSFSGGACGAVRPVGSVPPMAFSNPKAGLGLPVALLRLRWTLRQVLCALYIVR